MNKIDMTIDQAYALINSVMRKAPVDMDTHEKALSALIALCNKAAEAENLQQQLTIKNNES